MNLRWVKTTDGVWVDRDAFYCIRRNSCSPSASGEVLPRPRYVAYETYPGLPVDPIGTGFDLSGAKAICQARSDRDLNPGMEAVA
ncbi:MAG: hypothetical protein OXH83_17810 [Bryobacterales bacterium]|nr:hypothetical protein [Bryobacterales bacterium]MDE0623523.1 hypothetical protein [Bryobacterales bacterium]